MKIFLMFGFTLFLFKSFAQKDTAKIYNSTRLKKGIYNNYKEFINNSPSITWDFIVVRDYKSKTDSTIISAKFQFIEKKKFVKRLWGFCDGEYVYVNFGNLSTIKNYWKLEDIGRYPFFTYAYSKQIIAGPAILTAVSIASVIGSPGQYDIMVVDEKGKFKSPDYDFLMKALSSRPDLTNTFEEEWVRFAKFDYPTYEIITEKDREERKNLIKKYLIKINERPK